MNFLALDAVATVIAVICVYLLLSRRGYYAKGYSLPPGPKGLPLIGNVFDMPSENQWEAARQWGGTYGKLIADVQAAVLTRLLLCFPSR